MTTPSTPGADRNLPCPVCRAPARLDRADLYDDRYAAPGRYDLFACPECGHQFLSRAFTAEELVRLYSDYYPRAARKLEDWEPSPEMSWVATRWNREDSSSFRWVPENCRVLDIGCGFGESLGYHQRRGCEAWGIEADENILRVANRFGFNARVGIFRAADFPADYFDFVTLDQVIEHVGDPVNLLREAAAVLRPGGYVLLGTPNGRSLTARLFGRRWAHLHIPYHLQLFSTRSLRLAAANAGLELVESSQITNPRWYLFQWLHLLTYPQPGQPSGFWTHARLSGSAWAMRWLLVIIDLFKVNHVLATVLDAARVGDNLVMVLRKPAAPASSP